MGEAAVVDAVVVVEVQVGVELAPEAGVAGVDVAGEGGPPALVEDRGVERFDIAVGLRASRVDALWRALRRSSVALNLRLRNSLPLSESIRSSRQPAAFRSLATRRASFEVWSAVGLWLGQTTSSAQANEEAMSIAVSCQIAPSVPLSRPT